MQKARTRNFNLLPTFCSNPQVLICLVPDIYSTDHPPHNILQSKSFRLQDNMQPKSSGGYSCTNHCVSQLANTSPSGWWARDWQTHHEDACINTNEGALDHLKPRAVASYPGLFTSATAHPAWAVRHTPSNTPSNTRCARQVSTSVGGLTNIDFRLSVAIATIACVFSIA